MYITLESDYAIRITNFLAMRDTRIDAKSIAENTGVSHRFCLKILRKLVANGIAASFKGAKGGYILARNPGDITLKDIIETVEGEYIFSRCLDKEFVCPGIDEKSCYLGRIFQNISHTISDMLKKITVEQMICEVKNKSL